MGKIKYFKELDYRLRGLPERERQNILAVYEELFQKAEENGKSENDIVESLGFPRVPNWDTVGSGTSNASESNRGTADVNTGSRGAVRESEPAPYTHPAAESTYSAAGSGRPPADPLRDPNAGFAPPTPHVPQRGPHIPPYTPPYHGDTGFAPPPYREPIGSGAKPWIAGLALAFFNLVFILGPFVGLCCTMLGVWIVTVVLLFSPLLALVGTGIPHDTQTLMLLIFGSMAAFGAGLMMIVVMQFVTKWVFKITSMYVKFNWKIIKGA